MSWKALLVVVMILAAATSVSWYATKYYKDYKTEADKYAGITWFSATSTLPDPNEPVPPITTALTQATTTIGPVAVSAVTKDSISIKGTGTQKDASYTITKDTQLFSLVSAGSVGRPWSDLAAGTMVKLQPLASDPTKLLWLAFARDASLEPTSEELKHPLLGTVTAVTNDTMTVTTASSTQVTITITPSTHVLYTVMAGQTAKAAEAGKTSAVVWGATASGNTTTARVIVLSPLLPRPN